MTQFVIAYLEIRSQLLFILIQAVIYKLNICYCSFSAQTESDDYYEGGHDEYSLYDQGT
jgi:hypothetical protein